MAPLDKGALCVFVCALPLLMLDVLLYFVSLKWLKNLKPRAMSSVAVGEETSTHGCPRRSPKSPDKLIERDDMTLYDAIHQASTKYGDQPALKSRKFVELKKLKETDRFPTKIYADEELEIITYKELGEMTRSFGAGLRKLGMEPIPQLKENQSFNDAKGKFVMVLFEDTCQQWTVALHGAVSQSVTVATCYATLGEDAVVSAVNETNATTLLLNWKKATKFSELAKKMPTLQYIIASTYEMPKGTPTPAPAEGSKIQIVTTQELLEMGRQHLDDYPPVPPKSHDVAVIMYTSGSTGKPKGVLMKHSQMVSGVSGMAMNVDVHPGKEVVVSYLPLAHVLALQIETALLSLGSQVCYSDARQLATALGLFRPTVHAGVPKVYEIIQGTLLKKLAKGPPLAKHVFDAAYFWKSLLLSMNMEAPFTDMMFFSLVAKKVFGGRLRFAISGGGPLNASLHNFCRVCFCCPMVQGYALTETCVGGCFQALDDFRDGVVGPPVPCVEIMLQSEPEIKDSAGLPYLHTDTVSSKGEPVIGRGEICMRGPCISSGYYKLPEKTKEEYDKDGWFHTGDIGQFTSDGVIMVIDRKKNIVKLKGGEYVAVEAMETAFAESPFVQLMCVLANGDLDRPLAVVRAEKDYLKSWAIDNNITYTSLQELADRPETRKAVVQSMKEAGKEAGLTSLETGIKDCCIITDEEWGPGHGMTASMKLDRAQICKMNADRISAMYERNGVKPS